MTSFSLWMPSPLFLFLTVLFFVFFLFLLCHQKAPIWDIFPLLWQKASSPPCMDAQPLYDGKYCWKPMLCGNDRISCQSASPPPSCMLLVCVTQKKGSKKRGKYKCLYGVWLLLFLFRVVSKLSNPSAAPSPWHAVCSSGKPSAEVVCFSPHAVPLAHRFTWRGSTNYLMRAGRPAWAPSRRTDTSLRAHAGQPLCTSPDNGESEGESSPELASSFI